MWIFTQDLSSCVTIEVLRLHRLLETMEFLSQHDLHILYLDYTGVGRACQQRFHPHKWGQSTVELDTVAPPCFVCAEIPMDRRGGCIFPRKVCVTSS